MIDSIRHSGHWLAAGLLLTFASAFGQTWFIALFAGEIMAAHGLSNGEWGSLFTAATLGSAALLYARGALADTMAPGRLAVLVAALFALACLGLALAPTVWALAIALLGLRFCGQGMFSHIAMTMLGRRLRHRRGRAVSIATLGYSAGEILLALPAVLLLAAVGWRATWGIAAALLAFAVAPLLARLLARGAAADRAEPEGTPGLGDRHWTRGEAVRHWLFPALLPISLTPGFVGTVVFFHQAHLAEIRGWTLAGMAPGYAVYAVATVAAALVAGRFADRHGPDRLLPPLLLPMGFGVLAIALAPSAWGWVAALGLVGLTQGTASALWGAFLPAVYGTRHLGAVRALSTTVMLVATAAGPGITGHLIDAGVALPQQYLAMGLWCLMLSLVALLIRRGLAAEAPTGGLRA